MAVKPVIRADLQVDLQPFSQILWQHGIVHRVHEQAGVQVLSVDDEASTVAVEALYQAYLAGRVQAREASTSIPHQGFSASLLRWVTLAPVTLLLVFACVLGALIVFSGQRGLVDLFTFQAAIELGGSRFPMSPSETFELGQFWRLWTPIFLHFTVLHLVFNGLWLWEFGRRIEVLQGHRRLLILVLLIALVSNVCQYLFTRDVTFGGMSGVVYGLVGYIWGWGLIRRGQDFGVPRVLIYALIGLMLVTLTGIFTWLGFGAIANAAHVSGFIAGLALGLLLAWLAPQPYRAHAPGVV